MLAASRRRSALGDDRSTPSLATGASRAVALDPRPTPRGRSERQFVVRLLVFAVRRTRPHRRFAGHRTRRRSAATRADGYGSRGTCSGRQRRAGCTDAAGPTDRCCRWPAIKAPDSDVGPTSQRITLACAQTCRLLYATRASFPSRSSRGPRGERRDEGALGADRGPRAGPRARRRWVHPGRPPVGRLDEREPRVEYAKLGDSRGVGGKIVQLPTPRGLSAPQSRRGTFSGRLVSSWTAAAAPARSGRPSSTNPDRIRTRTVFPRRHAGNLDCGATTNYGCERNKYVYHGSIRGNPHADDGLTSR